MTIAPVDSTYSSISVTDLAPTGHRGTDSISSDPTGNRTDQSNQATSQTHQSSKSSNTNSNSNSSTNQPKPIEDKVTLNTLPSQVQVLTRQGETPEQVAAQLGLTVNIVNGELGVTTTGLGTDTLSAQPSTIPTYNIATQAR